MTTTTDATRPPLLPPFPIGTRLRYLGRHITHQVADDGTHVPIYAPGLVVTITKIVPGKRGTGRQLRDEDGPMTDDETGEPIIDTTRNGYSVYDITHNGQRIGGRCIDAEDTTEWEPA